MASTAVVDDSPSAAASGGASTLPVVHEAGSIADHANALGEFVAQAAAAAVKARGKFTIALSGGSLPKNLGVALATQLDALKATLPKWHVLFADERCVALDSDDSNYRACSTHVFGTTWGAAIPSEQVYAIDASKTTASEVAADYTTKLQTLFGADSLPEFDLILLGMGPDGHTCSLFPGHALLSESKAWVASIEDSPKPPPKRVTLTFPVVNKARQVAFVCGGASKAESLAAVFGTTDLSSALPAARVRPSSAVTWFVDAAAMGTVNASSDLKARITVIAQVA